MLSTERRQSVNTHNLWYQVLKLKGEENDYPENVGKPNNLLFDLLGKFVLVGMVFLHPRCIAGYDTTGKYQSPSWTPYSITRRPLLHATCVDGRYESSQS